MIPSLKNEKKGKKKSKTKSGRGCFNYISGDWYWSKLWNVGYVHEEYMCVGYFFDIAVSFCKFDADRGLFLVHYLMLILILYMIISLFFIFFSHAYLTMEIWEWCFRCKWWEEKKMRFFCPFCWGECTYISRIPELWFLGFVLLMTYVCFVFMLIHVLNLQGKLVNFRMKELKDVLTKLGLPKQGKKQVISFIIV